MTDKIVYNCLRIRTFANLNNRICMSKQNTIQAKAYLRNVAKLQAYIRENDYHNGGWLPAGRKMAQIMGTSHLTYVRAVKFLESEGIVKPFPNRGHYVLSACIRCQKVGLIINGGEYVPFLAHTYAKTKEGYQSEVSAIIETLAQNHYDTQFIQMPSAEQAFEIAEAYYMQGLIWLNPLPKDYDAILKFQKKKNAFPFIVATENHKIAQYGINAVTLDRTSQICNRIRHIIKRGHKKFLYMGEYEVLKNAGALKIISDANCKFSPADCFHKSFLDMPELSNLVKAKGYTAIVANGGLETIMHLFESLKTLTDKPEVLLHNKAQHHMINQKAPKIFKGYPKQKIVSLVAKPIASIGAQAVTQLLGQISKHSADLP